MKALTVVIILLAFAAVGAGGWILGRKNNPPGPMPIGGQITPTGQIVGGDRDEHGCIGSAGYSWCDIKQKCLRIWEEACAEKTDEDTLKAEIKAALIKKHGQNAQNLVVSVNKVAGSYAQGGAAVSGQGGGMWFAAKVDGIWQLVWDGNGVILCSDLTKFPDFPTDLIPECYDNKTDKQVIR